MRSKKVLVIVAALVACLAIGSATVATAKKKKTKKITTTISLAVAVTPASPYAPYPPGTGIFSGKVKAKGPSGCRKNRTVTISRGGPIVGQVGTDPNGNYTSHDPDRTARRHVHGVRAEEGHQEEEREEDHLQGRNVAASRGPLDGSPGPAVE